MSGAPAGVVPSLEAPCATKEVAAELFAELEKWKARIAELAFVKTDNLCLSSQGAYGRGQTPLF